MISHPIREDAFDAAGEFIAGIAEQGVSSVVLADQRDALQQKVPGVPLTTIDPSEVNPRESRIEVVVVFGGDGTILRAADWALPRRVPMLGVNLGHVGFLAELERSDMNSLVRQVIDRAYTVEDRLVLEVTLTDAAGEEHWRSFAANELSVEKASRRRMLDLIASIDGLAVQRWNCDGILVSTPTGSTAYAFSAGGPVMWPDVDAILMVPVAAHALFARPLVTSPRARLDIDIQPDGADSGIMWCDGRRSCQVRPGDRITVVRHEANLRIARLSEQPFTSRLVKKFALPVVGWRQGQATS